VILIASGVWPTQQIRADIAIGVITLRVTLFEIE
jgi:hypothetical protein